MVALASSVFAPSAALAATPSWVRSAVKYLDDKGYMDRDNLRPNQPMSRRAFKRLMQKAFGGGYSRTVGKVQAGEVARALVRKLGKGSVAGRLTNAVAPDGWRPELPKYFGTEIVAREMVLRHDRPTSEERFESSSGQPMTQADIAWSVWKAKTDPSTWGADALKSFSLSHYGDTRRKVVQYALRQVGVPYVWAGEWANKTPPGYPYGSQVHGGFDCSGFIWYVLREKTEGWAPANRPYRGWRVAQRSSADMAAATRDRLRFKQLRPGDVVFFAPNGRRSSPSSVYHAGVYLGKGWMIHSSGSRAGVSISYIGSGSWWRDQVAWGRRVIR